MSAGIKPNQNGEVGSDFNNIPIFPAAPACRAGIRPSAARNQADDLFFLRMESFAVGFRREGNLASVIFTAPLVVVILGD